MSEEKNLLKVQHVEKIVNHNGALGGTYFLVFLGAAFYYIQVADSFWGGLLGIIKAIVWPAFVAYEVFRLLQM